MKLYRTAGGAVLAAEGAFFRLSEEWDALINHEWLASHLRAVAALGHEVAAPDTIAAPIGTQEVWAAGVTYQRSRAARIGESKQAGGDSFYDRVYDAERPELFFKAAPWRVRGPGQTVRIRRDARWSVPEPELVLCVNARAEIVGYTIGNDMSSRDIEGENPLYLPQAKTYDGACALGPALLVGDSMPPETRIELRISRGGAIVYEGGTALSQMRRTPADLVQYLYRETSFPSGCLLFTGTGVIPPDEFSLRSGDSIEIVIPPIGSLVNVVE